MHKALAVAAALILSPAAWADTLRIPMELTYVGLNGEKVSTSLFSHKSKVELQDGVNRVALKYNDLVPESIGDGHEKVESNPFVIELQASGGQEYTVALASRIRNIRDAKAFAEAPKVVITDRQGNEVAFNQNLTEGDDPNLFDRMLGEPAPGQTVEQVAIAATAVGTAAVATSSAASAPAAVATTAPAAAAPVAAAPVATEAAAQAPAAANPQAEAMLKYWWEQADEQTRKAFMSWAITQM
ncbi:DUF2057 domain-containing protein [Ferrimonas marina]|uniref:Uncharacterized protein n=1 Tax=Ferrimonas marina TaxID=299255 RepID=A0A1M5RPU7_9GAMM|nr:DUF2057 domain-containing protein [Ferrimonas marina]SHH28180.1 hypothetical protein SAMN02745129_1699 [Ferrimonas marina]